MGASGDLRSALALPGDQCTREPSSLQGLAQLILPVTSSITWLHHGGVTSVIPGDTKSAVQGDPSITFKEQIMKWLCNDHTVKKTKTEIEQQIGVITL